MLGFFWLIIFFPKGLIFCHHAICHSSKSTVREVWNANNNNNTNIYPQEANSLVYMKTGVWPSLSTYYKPGLWHMFVYILHSFHSSPWCSYVTLFLENGCFVRCKVTTNLAKATIISSFVHLNGILVGPYFYFLPLSNLFCIWKPR